ncbi:MAG: TonB-dependent receptor [Pseudomonadota bacterium]
MKSHKQLMLSAITLGVLALLSQRASAADAPAADAPARPAKDAVTAEIQQVVVTGSANSGGVRKIDASYSITTATEEQLKQAAPSSTADLLKIVPGVFAESSGGNAGANIEVRGFPSGGDAPFVTIQMQGSPLFPTPTLSFLENSSLFRIDDTVERVEVLRGGPSPIYSNGQPGATVNFLLKKGGDTPEGSLRFTGGTGSMRRVDGYYGGKVADKWYVSVGGFYRVTQGVRDGQFPADDGSQLSATLTRKLDQGELTIYARTTSDKNAFYTGVPLVAAASKGGKPSAFPGFDPLTGTPLSNELRNVTLEVSPGKTVSKDLADGRGLKASVFGADFNQNIEGWQVSNKVNYFNGDAPTLAIFTGNTPLSIDAYVASAITSANKDAAVTAAAGRPATKGVATFASSGSAVPAGQQVMSAGIWSVEKNLKSVTDEFRVSKELVPGHTVTAGAYIADYSSHDLWYLGNGTLMTATSNARPISVKLDNGVVVAGASGRDGATFYAVNANYNGHNTAAYLSDEWKVSEAIKVDVGVRQERQRINGSLANLTSGDADNNPLTVYNNNTSMTTAATTGLTRTDNAFSYTVGGNYKLDKDFSIFARANSGHGLPTFEDLRNNGTQAKVDDKTLLPQVDVKQYELGLKTVGSVYSAYLTFFHNDFTGVPYQQFLSNGTVINSVGGSTANGLEFEVALRPIPNLQLALTGDYQDSKYKDFGANSNNRVQRQPKLQFRFTPSYRIPLGDNSVKLYGTYTSIGERFSDVENQQVLPSYRTLDAGVLVQMGEKLELRVSGTNLTNQLGLTEGNARIIGAGGGTVFARPIFGRAVEASILYRF